ncbi:MAG: hypothetical protein JWL80_114 [Parcubacteria group bacterium]|nr:hypothetical protein [Parcubacteria group bacterium]
MDTFMKADIFFFVTTIAVVVVSIGIIVSLYYIVGAVRRLEAFAESIESNMKDASAEVKETIEDFKDSFVYNFLFRKKRKKSIR